MFSEANKEEYHSVVTFSKRRRRKFIPFRFLTGDRAPSMKLSTALTSCFQQLLSSAVNRGQNRAEVWNQGIAYPGRQTAVWRIRVSEQESGA